MKIIIFRFWTVDEKHPLVPGATVNAFYLNMFYLYLFITFNI